MRRDLYYKKEVRREFENFGNLWSKAMLCLYHSLLLSHVCYCMTNLCFGKETRIHQLQRICNKFIRLVFGLKKRDSVKNVMKQNGLLTIEQVYHVELAIFMYKTVKKLHPVAILNLFQLKSSLVSTRSNSLYISPVYRLTMCQQSIKFQDLKYGVNCQLRLRKARV